MRNMAMAWERKWRRPFVTLAVLLVMSLRVEAENLEVTRLQRIDPASINIFCTTTNGVTPNDDEDQYELSFANPQSKDINLVSTSKASSNPQVFELDVQTLYGGKTAFTLALKKKEDQSVKASTAMTFEMQDVSGVKASWVGVRQAAGPGVVLRLYGHPVSVLACPEEGEDNSDCLDFSPEDNYRESSGLSGLSAALCMRMEEDPTLPFCLVSVAIMTVIGTPYEDEIRLSHQEDQAAAPEGTLFIAENIATGSTRDLLYWSDEKLGACPRTSICKIGDFPSNNNQYEVFFVDYQEADGEIIETSSVMQFEDFSPVGTVIEPNMLEIRWTKTTEQYNLLLTDPNGDEITTQPPPFTSIVVNCGGLNECFGYFIDLPQGDYKVMIRPWTGINLIMTNSVLSSKQTILNSESKPSADLEIQKVHLDWNSDVSKAFASVCFTHKAETSKNLSHFELVMVNQKGQWVRSRAATQKTDEGACFTGVTLLSDEFFLSGKVTVIVIERDFDGLSVVASAHTETFFKTTYDLTITKFEIVDKGDKKFSVHFSGASDLVSAGVLSVINTHSDSVTELNMELTDVSDTEGDFVASDLLMSWINRHKVLKWVLRLHAGDDILMFGGADFTFPDLNTFPTCSPAHLIGQKQMVRLTCNDQSLETDTIVMTGDDLAIQACTGVKGVNYHLLDKPATLPASIQLCRKVEDNLEVDICTGHIEVIDATADAAALTAIKVEYESKISVQQTPPGKNNFDSLVYYYKRDPDPLTIKYCTEDNCEMQGYIGVEELEVLVVYVDGTQGEPVKSEQRTVYGLELRGTQISNSVSELAIKKRPDRDVYQVIIENISPPGMEVRVPTFTTAKVMCQDMEITCYAYFSLTAGEKYKAIVSPYDDKAGEGAPDDMNQIVSLDMTVLQYSRKRVTKDTKELTLKQINRVKADATRFSTDVTVVNDLEDIKNIASVTLAIMHDNGEQYEAISNDVGDGTIQQNTEKVFHFDINPTDNVLGPKTTVLFIAKDASNGPLAIAEVTVDFQTLDPTMSWVGGPDTAPLRVSTDKDVEINGVPFSAGTSYSLDFINALPPVEVCVTLENTAPAGGTVRLCDLTRSIESFKDMDVDEVELNTNDGKRGMTVTSTFKGMEAVLYNPGDSGIVDVTFTCATENTCSSDISDQMSKLSPVFKMLVVGVDAPDVVTGAKVVDFEDFQTFVQRFSDASDLEVRWQASSNQDFNVHLENDVPGGFTDVAVHCGGDDQRACKTYFTNLAPDAAYTAKVIKDNIAVSYTTPATAGATTPLSITQLSEVSTSPLQTKLTFLADAEVTGVKYVEYVVIDPLTDGKAAQRIVFKDTNDNIAAGDNNIIFDAAELPNSGAVSTVLVVVHGADPDALAAGKVVAAFEDIKPTMSWVGGEDTAPLRVSTDMDVEINGVPFSAGTSYSLDFINALPSVEVCVTLENTAPAGGTVRLCDLTRSIESFKDMDVDEVELNTNDGKRGMTVTSTFKGMEAVLYNPGDSGIVDVTFTCATENTCSSDISDQMSKLSPVFKVLVVGVDAPDVVSGAKVVDFEDFQTFVQRFSDASDLEVRWQASSNQDFNVHLENDVPGGFTDVAVHCGGDDQRACKTYFTNLAPDAAYTAKVIKDNIAVSYTTPATAGATTPLSITQLSEVSTSPLQTKLTFSADAEVTGVKYVEYVVIDPLTDGKAAQRIVFKDTNDNIAAGDNNIIFDAAELPNSGAVSTVLVVVHGADPDALAAGKVVAAFEDIKPTMSWVGGEDTAPLRVSTDMDVEINGVPFSAGTSYSLDFINALPLVEVCVTLENTAPAGGTVRLCDLTRSIESFKELSVDKIELNYDAGKHVMTVSSTFAGMEAVLYQDGASGVFPGTFSCDTENTCSSLDINDQISNLSPTFKVLVVGVGAGTVTGAKVVDFVDFQVRVQRFSAAGDLEVRWRASSEETYKIHLDTEVPDGFTDVSVVCGGTGAAENRGCKAYFTKLEADTPYKAELRRDNTVVSATVSAAPGAYTPVTITHFTKVSTSPLQTKLTFLAEAEVTGVEYVEYVVIDPPTNGEAAQRIVFTDTNENIVAGDNSITFDVTELPNPGAVLTVLVVVHGADGVDSDALAAGKVTVVFEDPNPTMTWVGGLDTAPLRVNTNLDLEINGVPFSTGISYSLDFNNAAPPVEVCVKLDNTAPAGGTVRQCDVTWSIGNVEAMTVNGIELNYDAGKHVMTVSSTFAGMEAVLYQDGASGVFPRTFFCNTENTCSSPDINDQILILSPTFKVLVVGVDAGAVTGAKVVDIEDFQVRVQRFSAAGDLEVRWRASSKETYKIHLDTEVPDGFTDVSVVCGGAGATENRACKAYFTKLEADTPYKAELRRDNTVVSATVPAVPGSGIPVTITEIAQISPQQTQLTVTAEREVIGIEHIEYVVIDPPSDNEATQQITIKDVHCVINVDTDVVFDVQQLPNTGVEVTIFIVVHGRDGVDVDALAAGKVVVTLRDIQSTMNWVGGTDTPPLRIHANQGLLINGIQFAEGTSYLLEFDALGSNPEVCVTLENTAPAGGTVNQCDSTQTPENVAVLDVQKVELSHEADGKSTMIVSSTFTNMEAVLYNAGDSGKVSESFSCVTENTCSSDVTTILSELKTTFKFLAVGVDGADTVTGATLIDFEDFQTSALRFSDAGDLEVRWRASSDQLFNVHVNNNNPLGFTDVSVQCGGAEEPDQRACKAYYTMLKAGTTYKAEVKRDNVAVSTTVPPTSASVTPLTITRISQVSKSPSQTQLTVSAAAEVAGIGYLDYVMIDPPVDNIAPQHIAFSDAQDSIDTSSSIITFDDADQPQTLVEVTVLVVAYGADGRDGDILASGKVLVYFADLEPPKMTKVGTEEMKSLKAETGDFDVRVNGETCRAKSVCYFLEVDDYLEPPEVCRDTGSSVEQCDMTGSYLLPKNLVNPAVDLMYKGIPEEELTVTAEFDANSVTMEAMIYDDAGTETSSPITCTIKSSSCVFTVTPPSIMFKILLMALDSKEDVFETNAIEFEDFQTRMEQLASEALQVSWRASQALNYTVKLHPDPVGFPGVMQAECGGEQPEDSSQCLAFFVGLTAGGEYTGNVNKRDDGTRSVSAFLQLETERVYTPIIITSLIAREEGDKTRSLSVCFKDDLLANRKGSDVMTQTGDLKYSLVVVDAFGRHFLSPADLLSLSPSSNVEDDLCFSAISLGLDFDLRKKLRVFVKREATAGERGRAVGDIEVHLLDPQGLVDVRQVGPRTVRVRWKDVNRALGYEVRIGDVSLPAACGEDSEKECVRYLHVDRGESRLFVTLKAVGARVRQEVEVPLALRDLSTLRIYSTALTEDNRLRVCFDPIPRAYQYLLGLEDEKSLVLESRRVFPQQEDDLTCVLSAEEVDLRGQLSRRTLVTAFDASDKPVASGTATVQEFFLSPKRKVFAVANETNHDLIATWFLLDDPEKVTAYYVTLEQATGGRKDDDPVVLSRTSTSHVFEGVTSGRYSVCVVASAEGAGSVFRSREVCSDIVSVPSAKVKIPEVAETEVKSAGLDKALVTWQKTEDEDDVTNYVITWTKAAPSTSNRARPRQPLPLVAQGFRDVEQGRHHRIVPASSPSLEVLPLDPREVYEVCVSAVRKGVAGNHKCKRIELGKDDPLDSPSDLVFEKDLLEWKEVASASGYLVEWRPRLGGISEGGQEEVKTTSWPAGNLSPGWWVVSVRAVTETRASQPVAAEYLKKGIEIVSAVQPNNNQLLLRWQEEPIPPCAESMCNYTITISHDKAPFWHSCSGLKGDCEKVIQVEGGTQVEVALERNGVKNSMKEVIYDFSEVSGLSERSSSADKEVTVSWTPSEEAVLYNVTLFTDRARSSIRLTEMISRETLTLREDNMAGNVLLVQPCADKHHCGSGQNITVMSVADTPSTNVPVLATSVAVGVLLAGLVLAASVVIMKKTKRKQMNDTCRLEEVARAPSVSSQQSIGLHSSDHQIISLSALSLEGNKQQ
ncbi:uncharacterized protein LOC119573314 isoform X4 [Penaeus monodon]|uniref:uncharacterized protein LOC119573314 isoform X4 n=1 Tax=Penaeus monodon TaxID=6687 RepID=UPI0018A754C8|nr:uncharacterized protein LOC119573314 isoform X4 [Penaeus monodon]